MALESIKMVGLVLSSKQTSKGCDTGKGVNGHFENEKSYSAPSEKQGKTEETIENGCDECLRE